MEPKHRTVLTLVTKLSSVSERIRTEALSELREMSKLDPETRPMISDSGAIPYLAETLYSSSHTSQENAAVTLLNLSISVKEPFMSTRGVLDAIAHILSHHNSTSSSAAVQSSAATIHSLLATTEDFRHVIGAKREIVYALVDILRSHSSSPARMIKDALKALFAISLYPLNRATVIHLGAVPALFNLVVKDGRVGLVEDATAVVAQVAGCEESAEAFRKVSGIEVLADLVASGGSSMRTKENAVSALLNLVRCGGESVVSDVREVAAAVVVVDGIADVVDNGSSKGKNKGLELLKVLFHESGGFSNSGWRLKPLISYELVI
ncbi:putative aminoacyltransferase, E1 ubiquitin-activating enzyme [Lupinus albus]|uniref:Putative aminoacyltransferase, E1 ubiquitin-activating enzyme n=1 Tax=Lupinus albus TaxID=3870 RepID=A0A6A4NL26_LUPAL|nr:putative aminoacyltransferase, E1 ubiquitin-activating enzyme [Lupinus albus]